MTAAKAGRRPDGLGDLRHPVGQAQAPHGQHGTERLAVGLAGQSGIEWFQSFGHLEQEQPTLAPDGQLGAQQLRPRPPELIKRAAQRHGQQPPRRVRRTGIPFGLRRVQRTASPASRLGRKLGGAFAERRRGGQAAAGAGPAGRTHKLRRDVLVRLRRGVRPMPCPLIRTDIGIGGLGESTVDAAGAAAAWPPGRPQPGPADDRTAPAR